MRKLSYIIRKFVTFVLKTKVNLIFTVALFVAINFYLSDHSTENVHYATEYFRLYSKCNCRKHLAIKKLNNNKYLVDKRYNINSYFENKRSKKNVDSEQYNKNYKHTCDMYNVLRRGPNQRVIAFSVYGKNVNYYKPLLILAEAVKQYFPGWIIRVYHNSDLDQSVACEYECKEDIIDFCNVDELPVEIDNKLANYKASYPHAMMWRWYPIADDFVDYFMSRDSDSITIQREKDSVDVWLLQKTNTLFHIMRDNPYHNIHILGGMWGYEYFYFLSNFRIFLQIKFIFKLCKHSKSKFR